MRKQTRGGRRRLVPHARHEQGIATIEIAIGIPILLVVGLLAAWCVSIGSTAVLLGSAASSAARSLARGETREVVAYQVERVAPGALIEVIDDGEIVSVAVTRSITPPGPILDGLGFSLTRTAAAAWEWAVVGVDP